MIAETMLTDVEIPLPPEPDWPDDDPRLGVEHQGDRHPQRASLASALLTRSALRELPDPAPLIAGVLDQGTVALLYGRWGTGKSFVALDWAASVATGRPWQGRPTEQRRVLYVAAEGAYGLKGRLAAWEVGWQTEIADAVLDVLPVPVNLTRGLDAVQLADLIAERDYGLVVLDTLARCMVGADENSARDCGEVVDTLVRLREQTAGGRAVILGVHHTGKDGKTFRGSSVFEAGADTVYSLNRDDGVIVLDREKRKDGPRADKHELKIDPVTGTGSCVISLHRGVEKPPRAQALFSTFLHHFSTTGATKTELRAVAEQTEGTFYRALDDLVKSGDLVNEGTAKRPFYRAVQS
ncbi:AAA family ATPase [Mycolicibacterium sp.]|uniref:AAA family ATPase n=1 Tax=Mycolicibacterium sp. TaxID=2320850 RepID=UPI0025EB3666|nr:AAA family ATPase [Mycolicibacterium sp.]